MAPRNLFRVRTAEYIKDDTMFLQLFGHAALDIFEPDEIWSRMQIIRSSRGGGKTSVLRIFSPPTLNAIKSRASGWDKLVAKLVELEVLSDTRDIRVLGVLLSLEEGYALLEKIGLDPPSQQRLFFALLASKIILSALRSVCELKDVNKQDGLRRIRVGRPDNSIRECVPVPCDGEQLYDWAKDLENRAYSVMEGESDSYKNMAGYEALSVVRLIQPSNLSYDGEPVAAKTLLMLDDVDKITSTQRKALARALADLRVPSIWMAERLEALRPDELLSVNGTEGREWGKPVILERFWRDSKHRARFASLLEGIADKRARMEDGDFSNTLGNIDEADPRFKEAVEKESDLLYRQFGENAKYKEWFKALLDPALPIAKQAAGCKMLSINIERERRSKQTRIVDDVALNKDELQTASNMRNVASFYIRQKYDIPYYHGFGNLVKLASSNIQQFLHLAGDLFDEITNARTARQPETIQPKRQEKILEAAAGRYWDNARRIAQDPVFEKFIETTIRFCQSETNLPNAPYYGVTGISISERDLQHLRSLPPHKTRSEYGRLASILSKCFAHNMLEPNPDSFQGAPGTRHLVMYLNRLLCVRYGLPLAYGGWRPFSLAELGGFSRGVIMKRRTADGVARRNGQAARGSTTRAKAASSDPAQRELEADHA